METSEEKKCCETKKCGCICHRMDGVTWVVIGTIILLWAFDVIRANIFWIIIGAVVIVSGLQKILSGACNCCDKTDGKCCN
jgi:hypothetical protein